MKLQALFVLPLLVPVASASLGGGLAPGGEDWPCFGGPDGTGISSEKDWSVKGKEAWSVNVGLGYSSVAVRGNLVYTLGFDDGAGMDVVYCLSVEDGSEVWSDRFPSKIMAMAHKGGTLTTPTLDGELLFVANRLGRLICYEAASGEVMWKHDQMDEHGLQIPTWGFAASPYVLGDHVIMNVGRVIAYDKRTGKPSWKSVADYGHAYATPQKLEYRGRTCLAVFTGMGLVVLDAKDGSELASSTWKTKYEVNAATPVVIGDRVFISSGYNKGCAMIELKPDGAEQVWAKKVMRNHMTGSILVGEHLYGFDDSMLKCIDLEGEEKWRKRGLGKGALSVAGGRLVVLSEKGKLIIADASPDGFEPLWQEPVLDGGVCWTSPVVAGGRIFCRNQAGDLVCMDHRSAQ